MTSAALVEVCTQLSAFLFVAYCYCRMDDAEAEAAVNDTYDNDEEEHCIRLKNGLDINKLQIGEPQEFEIYEEDEEYGTVLF